MARKDWKKVGKDSWEKKSNLKANFQETKNMVIKKIDGSYYVEQYNKEGFLLDSLIWGTHERALTDVKNIMRKH